MTSIKRLRSVIQSTAHHAVSGLCYVHPHLGEACKELGIKDMTLNLLKPEITPRIQNITKEIELSTEALRQKFKELLEVEHISTSDIENAFTIFNFNQGRWPSSCYIEVTTKEAKKVVVAVDSSGKTAEVLHAHS